MPATPPVSGGRHTPGCAGGGWTKTTISWSCASKGSTLAPQAATSERSGGNGVNQASRGMRIIVDRAREGALGSWPSLPAIGRVMAVVGPASAVRAG